MNFVKWNMLRHYDFIRVRSPKCLINRFRKLRAMSFRISITFQLNAAVIDSEVADAAFEAVLVAVGVGGRESSECLCGGCSLNCLIVTTSPTVDILLCWKQ
jgi:hypothetical protein